MFQIVRFLKQLSNTFRGYPIDVQKDMVRNMYYDKYHSNRVIVRKGLMADGIYFVLSGTLLHKTQDNKELEVLKPGECFGEEDLICGRSRQATIITETVVELLSLHRLDYRRIMNMADVTNDHTALDIFNRDIVLMHFPLHLIKDNPGVWTVLSYKFGRLIAKDSSDVDWVYVIMSKHVANNRGRDFVHRPEKKRFSQPHSGRLLPLLIDIHVALTKRDKH
ncbi:hypothetical protein LSAT2_017170 [Lamellibrachia satsuma]|nr:hypothetical protein LSAT2_017170 [Lamellibrachia satsuma]